MSIWIRSYTAHARVSSLACNNNNRGAAAVGDKPGVTKSLDFYRIGSRSKYVRLFVYGSIGRP